MKKKYIWSIICLFYVGFIFHNSMTPAIESSAQSGAVLEQIINILEYTGFSVIYITEHLVRKTAHVLEYTLLGIIIYQCFYQYELSHREQWSLRLLLGLLIPLVDESIQLFTPGRSGQISDVWLDFSGVVLGLLLIVGFTKWRRSRRKEVGD